MLNKGDRKDALKFLQLELFKLSTEKSLNYNNTRLYSSLRHKHATLQAMQWRITQKEETENDEIKVKDLMRRSKLINKKSKVPPCCFNRMIVEANSK